MLILRSKAGVADWEDGQMKEFILDNTRIPTGTVNLAMISFTLLALTKDNTEFGEYAATTALEILRGKPWRRFPLPRIAGTGFFEYGVGQENEDQVPHGAD